MPSQLGEIVVVGARFPASDARDTRLDLATWTAAAVQRAGGRLIDCEGYASLVVA